ncbi:hypothetical protein SUGI_0215720 [Cryptomeria japonica]|nr:hypothetical protein SUGI_0215720 [Cryptomeria japonica]
MDATRLTICVFVGCLLPGMATVGTVGRWSNAAALFVTLFFHIATKIYALQNINNSLVQSEAGPWFMSSGVVLLVGASSLLVLLGVVILSVMQNFRLSQNHRLRLRDIKRYESVDTEDALAAYRETVDVLKLVDCPENIVVAPLDIFGKLDFGDSKNSIIWEEKMCEVDSRLKQGLGRSHEEKRVRVERELTIGERARVNNMSGELNRLGEEMFNSSLIRNDEYCNGNVKELSEILCKLVGRVIVSCVLEAPDKLVKYTKQWAENFDEAKIERGVDVAGMVSEVLEKLVEYGDLHSAVETEITSESRLEASEDEHLEIVG